jgi:apolipoprotein N-acyltransferase
MASHWGRGTTFDPLVFGSFRLGTIICYEDILPRFVNRVMEPRGGRRPDVLLNLTNDSWYGDTVQPMEHLALAAFRSIEHRRALVRSTNTGISAFVDPAGRIVSRTQQYRAETLLGSVPKMAGTTVYEVVGDVFGWGALGILTWAWFRSRRRAGLSGA